MNTFSEDIENLIVEKNISYIDALLYWGEINNLEPETIAYWVKRNPDMKIKIQGEAEILNFLKK